MKRIATYLEIENILVFGEFMLFVDDISGGWIWWQNDRL